MALINSIEALFYILIDFHKMARWSLYRRLRDILFGCELPIVLLVKKV